jgi:succinoglycan biosynthesis protein ExoA
MKKWQNYKISVIIPAHEREELATALKALKKADYPATRIEVLAAYGQSPSSQRNQAVKKATGDVLYFLDNDSELDSQSLRRSVAALSGERTGSRAPVHNFSLLPEPICRWLERTFFAGVPFQGKVAAAGGPSIWDREESYWSSIAGIIFESFFAYFRMTSRFRPTGAFRTTDERELILCNLAVKRNVFNQVRGFREELYPNEENEFLSRLIKAGYDLIYHPGIYVRRPRRENFTKILKMFFNYGRGRMEHVRVAGIGSSWLFFAPLALLGYLAVLPFFHTRLLFIPLAGYLAMGFSSALGFAARRKKISLALFLPFFFLAVHLTYAFGMISGVLTDIRIRKKRVKTNHVEVQRIKDFEAKWSEVVI